MFITKQYFTHRQVSDASALLSAFSFKTEPAHDETYKTCATSEDSDHPAHPHETYNRICAISEDSDQTA